MNRFWVTCVVCVLIALGSAGSDRPASAEENSSEETSLAEQRQALLIALAREHSLTEPLTGKNFRLTERPVVHYTNPVRDRGTSDGVTFVWRDGDVPIAVSSFSIRRPDDSLRFECASFSKAQLELSRDGAATWAPASWQTAPTRLPAVPPPASLARQRLTQMRGIGRLFDVSCTRRRTTEATALRLLPQPLYRFSDPPSGIVDGALFAFVISNDPELLLKLEAIERDDKLAWNYSFARMTSLQVDVRRDNEVVWQVPNFYDQGASKYGPYIEGGIRSNQPIPAAD